jgi:hypothetical protein
MEQRITNIAVIDPPMYTGEPCPCGAERASHFLMIHNVHIHLCADCLAEVGKRVIDGLR